MQSFGHGLLFVPQNAPVLFEYGDPGARASRALRHGIGVRNVVEHAFVQRRAPFSVGDFIGDGGLFGLFGNVGFLFLLLTGGKDKKQCAYQKSKHSG